MLCGRVMSIGPIEIRSFSLSLETDFIVIVPGNIFLLYFSPWNLINNLSIELIESMYKFEFVINFMNVGKNETFIYSVASNKQINQ